MKKIIAPNIIIFILILFAITPIFFAILGSFKELKDIVTPIPKIFFNPTSRKLYYSFDNRFNFKRHKK